MTSFYTLYYCFIIILFFVKHILFLQKKSGRRPRISKIVYGRQHQREAGLLWKRSRKHSQAQKKGLKKGKTKKTYSLGMRPIGKGQLKKGYFSSWVLKRPEWERKKGLRIAMGTMKWEGHRFLYEVYMPKKDGNFFELHLFEPCTTSKSFVLEFDMYDMRSFLKGTHALELFEKRRKKFMKKFHKLNMGHNEKNDEIIPVFQLFLGERISLLKVGQVPREIVETVNGPHLKIEKQTAMNAKKELARIKREKNDLLWATKEEGKYSKRKSEHREWKHCS